MPHMYTLENVGGSSPHAQEKTISAAGSAICEPAAPKKTIATVSPHVIFLVLLCVGWWLLFSLFVSPFTVSSVDVAASSAKTIFFFSIFFFFFFSRDTRGRGRKGGWTYRFLCARSFCRSLRQTLDVFFMLLSFCFLLFFFFLSRSLIFFFSFPHCLPFEI
jgi:hypothetical protein